MEGVNGLVGGAVPLRVASPEGSAPQPETAVVVNRDERTEYIVAAFVLTALGLLVLFRVAGFNAVIATKVSVGG